MKTSIKRSIENQYFLLLIMSMLLLFHTCTSGQITEEQTAASEETYFDEEITEEDTLSFPTVALNQIGFLKDQPDKQIVISMPTETARPVTYYIEALTSDCGAPVCAGKPWLGVIVIEPIDAARAVGVARWQREPLPAG